MGLGGWAGLGLDGDCVMVWEKRRRWYLRGVGEGVWEKRGKRKGRIEREKKRKDKRGIITPKPLNLKKLNLISFQNFFFKTRQFQTPQTPIPEQRSSVGQECVYSTDLVLGNMIELDGWMGDGGLCG